MKKITTIEIYKINKLTHWNLIPALTPDVLATEV